MNGFNFFFERNLSSSSFQLAFF